MCLIGRQFGFPQHIPQGPEWKPKHFDVDLRTRVDQSLVDLLGRYFNDWRDRKIGCAGSWCCTERLYTVLLESRTVVDGQLCYKGHQGPTHEKEYYRAGFVPSAGSLAALSRGLRKIFKILKEVQKDPAHALWGHEIKSVVKQTFEEARDAIPSYGPFCDAESSYYNVNAQGRGEGRGRGRGHGRPRGRSYNEPSPFTPVVPSEAIPDMSGPYSMRPMELPSRPADGRPMRDVEAVRLSYGSAIGDGYIPDMPSDGWIAFVTTASAQYLADVLITYKKLLLRMLFASICHGQQILSAAGVLKVIKCDHETHGVDTPGDVDVELSGNHFQSDSVHYWCR
ncbi:hypothetical protein FXO37_15592 [Capsicum annuum]|nr:hypothetical protein FXO37_15592 [Capsicum annuum]